MAVSHDRAGLYTVEAVGKTRDLTPEGFLLCRDVKIARTGSMVYAAGEIPLEEDRSGTITVTRGEDDLFHPDTIASYEGKPVTNDHPEGQVTPDNWREVAVGTLRNVRRGLGADAQYLMADMLITDAYAIKDLQDGKREVSCGYDAEYIQVSPGRGEQRQIIGNHVALVEAGRCGPRCSVGDSGMADKASWKDKAMAAFGLGDRDKFKATLDEAPEDENHVHIHMPEAGGGDDVLKQILERLTALESKGATADADAEEAKKKADDEEAASKQKETDDAAAGDPDDKDEDVTTDSLAQILAMAEIIAPGAVASHNLGATADAKAIRAAAMDCKRKALTVAHTADASKAAVATLLGARKPTFDTMPSAALDAVFRGAAELMRAKNNGSATHDTAPKPGARTSADINKANRDFWAAHGVK